MPENNLLENKKNTPPSPSEHSDAPHSDAPRHSDAPHSDVRRKLMMWMVRISVMANLLSIALQIFAYFRTYAWQLPVTATSLLLSLVCVLIAGRFVRRDRLDTAGYLLFLSMAFSYGVPQLLFDNATGYVVLSVFAVTLLAGNVSLSDKLGPGHKWGFMLTVILGFVVYARVIDRLEPFPRYIPPASPLVPIVWLSGTVLYLGLLLGQIARTFSRGTIRARLILAFILVAFLPAFTIMATLFVVGSTNARRQTLNQLESVAKIKQAEIDAWLRSLETDLSTQMSGGQLNQSALESLLGEDATTATPSDMTVYTMRRYLRESTQRLMWFKGFSLIDDQGRVLIATDETLEGKNVSASLYFQQGLQGFTVEPLHYDLATDQAATMIARPLTSPDGQVLAVLAATIDATFLQQIMGQQTWIGDTGELYLVDRHQTLLTPLRFDERQGISMVSAGNQQAIEQRAIVSNTYDDYRGETVIALSRWIPSLEIVLTAKMDQSEARSLTNTLMRTIGYILTGVLAVVALVSVFIAGGIVRPVAALRAVATRIAAGDLTLTAETQRQDEIGVLSQAFNSMTTQLRTLIGNLEQRVAERTAELEFRSTYLETASEVGRAASMILDTDRLIQQVVTLIQERFEMYYVGLFLVETGEATAADAEAKSWAVLQAGTGEAGRAMLRRGHRIQIGKGMIGWSIAHAQARIASIAETDAVRLVTPELPETRSEAAIPLRSRSQVLGALSVQSERVEAFNEDMLLALQTMADQVAVAIDNARLFAESEATLQAERRAYGERTLQAWAELLQSRVDWGYVYERQAGEEDKAIVQVKGEWPAEMRRVLQDHATVIHSDAPELEGTSRPAIPIAPHHESRLTIPIRSRNQVIGALNFDKGDTASSWTDDEIVLLETLADQLGQALESAQLYQETQRRAARERLSREVTGRIRQSLNIEAVAKRAAQELGQILDAGAVTIRIGDAEKLLTQAESGEVRDEAA